MALHTGAPDVAAVLTENHRRFLTFLTRRVPTREIAEDILQEAFVRGLTRAPDLATTELRESITTSALFPEWFFFRTWGSVSIKTTHDSLSP